MISYISHVMTLANSIIGVSVLAMPFCFKQCGIVLSIIVLLLCSSLSRIACHFLIKSAVMSRRRNYEFLAFHAFGPMAKILVELLIIGFLIGTCIAFFVVIGDLGPQIIGKLINKSSEDIKISFLLTITSLIILPLGLLKNIGSLANICTVSIGFYLCLVLKVIVESMEHIFMGDWYDDVNYWRPAGILQCLPIFSMALFCQTQLFEIYESIPNVSLEKMNTVVRGAINICTLVYISVGFFGYIAFRTQSFSGNILMSFQPSMTSDVIKIGFVLSVIASFPLVIFPCRASLNSLLFRRVYIHEAVMNYIPESRFRCLTFMIITISLIIGSLMPNIEFVLGLVGSTIGVMICLIFPAAFFITISTKNTNERLMAQTMLFIGMWIMILGTYANVYYVEDSSTTRIDFTEKSMIQINNLQLNPNIDKHEIIPNVLDHEKIIKKVPLVQVNIEPSIELINSINIKHPVAPNQKIADNINLTKNSENIKKIVEESKSLDKSGKIQVDNSVKNNLNLPNELLKKEEDNKKIEQQANENSLNSEAIKKQDLEIAAAADQLAEAEAVERLKEQQRIKDTLEQNKVDMMKLMKEQKSILQNINEQKKELEEDKKLLQDLNFNKHKENIIEKNIAPVDDKNSVKVNDIIVSEPEKKNKGLSIQNKSELSVKKEDLPKTAEIREVSEVKNNPIPEVISTAQNQNQAVKNVNASLESRGPILHALINKTIEPPKPELPLNVGITVEKNNQNDSKDIRYAIPIALKLINQTKESTVPPAIDLNDNANKPANIRRDILVDHDREKRDVENLIDENNISKGSNVTYNDTGNLERIKNELFISTNNQISLEKVVSVTKSEPIELIKTDVYLSDEKFVNNIMKVNLDSLKNINELQVMKKRDLKSFNSEYNRR